MVTIPHPRRANRVLLVDDDPDTLASVGEGLEMLAGMHVVTATSGHDALAKLEDAHPDALITDFRMPGMDGVELARRARVILPRLPVVIITAFNDTELQGVARSVGVCEVIPKPIDVDPLVETVERCCC